LEERSTRKHLGGKVQPRGKRQQDHAIKLTRDVGRKRGTRAGSLGKSCGNPHRKRSKGVKKTMLEGGTIRRQSLTWSITEKARKDHRSRRRKCAKIGEREEIYGSIRRGQWERGDHQERGCPSDRGRAAGQDKGEKTRKIGKVFKGKPANYPPTRKRRQRSGFRKGKKKKCDF